MMNAIFAGISHAASDYIITLEADVPVEIKEIFNIITKYNDENYDILIGSRYLVFPYSFFGTKFLRSIPTPKTPILM